MIPFSTVCLVNLILVCFLFKKLKELCISSSFTVTRETELQGENVAFSGNSYFWDSAEKRFQRLNEIAETIVERKGYCFQRYENIVRQTQAENVAQLKQKDT